jgi:hypothetical protein
MRRFIRLRTEFLDNFYAQAGRLLRVLTRIMHATFVFRVFAVLRCAPLAGAVPASGACSLVQLPLLPKAKPVPVSHRTETPPRGAASLHFIGEAARQVPS